mgnify:CR=1 FL=1
MIGEASSTNFIWQSGFLYFGSTPAGPKFSLTVSGLDAGTATEGVVTDVSTTPLAINFNDLNFNEEVEAAHRLTVKTNAPKGYQVFIFARSPLSGLEEIAPVAGTNEFPIPWGITTGSSSAFGYHAGDDTLSGGSGRFAPNNSYAQLEEIPQEVVFSAHPTGLQATDVVFKIQITEEQAAGDYETEIGYVAVPVF